jgi:hypothetical protein
MNDECREHERLAVLERPPSVHNPGWFERCIEMDAAFEYERFGRVAVVLPTDSERRQSLFGSFYIYDGVHRTLVLAKRLLSGQIHFRPLIALMLVPRPRD